jgi:hypothetical protein
MMDIFWMILRVGDCEKEDYMIDYEGLLKKYMMMVVDADCDYLDHIGAPYTTKLLSDAFNQEEISELKSISKKIKKELGWQY